MKIKHLFFVLVACSLAFVSCKKDENKPQNNDKRTPLAMRTASGDIVSLVDCEKLTAQMKTSKDYADNFVVESVEIIDKTSEEPYYFLINLIDVESGKSISSAYIGEFVEEESNIFYAVKDFEDGNYGLTDKDGQQYKFENHNLVEPGPCMTHGFWINCEGEGCKYGTCRPKHFHCKPCEDAHNNPDNPAYCGFSGLGWGTDMLLGFIPSLIHTIFS